VATGEMPGEVARRQLDSGFSAVHSSLPLLVPCGQDSRTVPGGTRDAELMRLCEQSKDLFDALREPIEAGVGGG
jgi:hypothetical protein